MSVSLDGLDPRGANDQVTYPFAQLDFRSLTDAPEWPMGIVRTAKFGRCSTAKPLLRLRPEHFECPARMGEGASSANRSWAAAITQPVSWCAVFDA